MLNFLKSRLSPFRHRQFTGYFLVQAFSLIGTWSHDLARAWIVIELMGTAGALGSVMMAVAIPSLFLILWGGAVVDRLNVKMVMVVTKSILAVSAITLASIVEYGQIEMWMLYFFGIIEGCVAAIDFPAFSTLTVRLVPRKDFQQAIAINSTNFHSARMLGPLVAGLLMAWHGPSLVFLIDGLSYLGLIILLSTLNLRNIQRDLPIEKNPVSAVKKGFHYFFVESPALRYKLLQLLATICLIFPLSIVIFRVYIQQKFDLDAEHFGYFFTMPAMGAMFGAVSFAAVKPKKPIRALAVGVPFAIFMYSMVPSATTVIASMALLAAAGFFMFLSFSSITVSLHLEVQEEYRGRMGSLVGMCFLSIGPLMGFPIGVFADRIGHVPAIYIMLALFALISAVLAALHRREVALRLKNT